MARFVCTKCGKKKPETDFGSNTDSRYKGKRKRKPVKSWCKACERKATKENRIKQKTANPDEFYREQNRLQRKFHKENPEKSREYFLKNTYGLTVDDFDKKFAEQNGVCAICGKKETSKNQYGIRRLNIDHNHITNKNRGLLCSTCNQGLGLFYIDEKGIELLLKAIEYTRKYNE